MRKSRILALLLTVAMALSFAACSGESEKTEFGGIALGDEELKSYKKAVKDTALPADSIGFSSMSDLALALDKGKIDAANVPTILASYLASRNDALIFQPWKL